MKYKQIKITETIIDAIQYNGTEESVKEILTTLFTPTNILALVDKFTNALYIVRASDSTIIHVIANGCFIYRADNKKLEWKSEEEFFKMVTKVLPEETINSEIIS